jgi:hypothetical protein
MTTFATFIIGCWVGFGLGLLFVGLIRAFTRSGAGSDSNREPLALQGSGEIATMAHVADRT